MSPIFPCKGCGTFIERSTQHYRRVKGQVLCSTCADARDAAAQMRPVFWRRWLQRFRWQSGGGC
ncbi:MAG: hypothetical protein FJ049_04755 [Cyanobacteria bacterium M_surface_7_m2_037]|nr:hypothetical protein [Cyanobacteria bacterium K_DeepCast_0m_m1_088]MBM5795420.1 hypothetical protein [Cyanobacteria bacterium M_surface_7_m2_037]